MKIFCVITTALVAVVLLAGCGGGGNSDAPTTASAVMTLQWPTRAATNIPYSANSVRIRVRKSTTLVIEIIKERPAAGGAQQVQLGPLPPGSLLFTLEAYAGGNCGGELLASGNLTIQALAGQQLSLKFDLSATIARLELTPAALSMAPGEPPIALVVTAYDSSNNLVAIPTGSISWVSTNPAVASVSNGVVTARALGTTTITVTEQNSKMEASAHVTVDEALRGEIAFISWRNGNYKLCLMNADGTNPHQLTTAANGWEDEPSWSWDGQRIYYISDRLSAIPNKWWFDIFVINRDGTNDHVLINNAAADWGPAESPDGSKLLFFRSMGSVVKDDIFVANADGTNQQLLIGADGMDVLPSYTPDGQHIIFASSREYPEYWDSPVYDIYSANTDGTNIQRLTFTGGRDWYYSVTPDSRQIVFDAGGGVIDIMNIDGTGRRHLLLPPTGKAYKQPSVSPDGRYVAFASNEYDGWDIFVANIDGTGKRRLTTTRGDDYMPKWRPVL